MLAVLGDLLVDPDGIVTSHRIGDTTRYSVFSREFGCDELLRGIALGAEHHRLRLEYAPRTGTTRYLT